jgi:hypothetical protein
MSHTSVPGRELAKAMKRPFGDQAGLQFPRRGLRVRFFRFDPSAPTTSMSARLLVAPWPGGAARNAICLPFGDQEGSNSFIRARVRRARPDPSSRLVQMSSSARA